MDRYINVLYQIVSAGQKTNSYKFALWRALAKLAPATNEIKPIISKQNLSTLFLQYYWPLEVRYHLRRGIDPKKDPIVMLQIRELMKAGIINHGESLRDFQKRMPIQYQLYVQRLQSNVSTMLFHDSILFTAQQSVPKFFDIQERLAGLATVLN
jgi:hypothetical protein